MNRRDFISITLPATGAVLIYPGCINRQVSKEINQMFSGKSTFDQYDIVINGAGLAGYFIAINAARAGKKVLVTDRGTSPGYEIAAKKKLWLGLKGFDGFQQELKDLFLPSGEQQEIHNTNSNGINSSVFGDEILIFSGSIRKGMLRNLLINKVHILLMTDICGILADDENVRGVLLAGKHGLHIVKCRSFIDTSENVMFSRTLLGEDINIKSAGFIAEMKLAVNPQKKEIKVPEEFGLLDNLIKLHQGKNKNDQLFMEFSFPASTQKIEEIEHQARLILAKIGKKLHEFDKSMSKAVINEFALECTINLQQKKLPDAVLKGHYMYVNEQTELTCEDILKIETDAKNLVDRIKYSGSKTNIKNLHLIGIKIPFNEVTLSNLDEPGFSVPLVKCKFPFENYLGYSEKCNVLIAGGGTSGVMALKGSREMGADTIIVDYFNDLGGTKTMGGVMAYYHGVKEHKFLQKQDEENVKIATEANMIKKSGRKIYHLETTLNSGGRFIPGAIMCGSIVKNNRMQGLLTCRNGKLGLIKGDITIDSTGDGDIAAFAGARYDHGNSRTGKTQNYSQFDIVGGGKLPSHYGRDYDIIDNTKISELQRGLFLSHYESHFYDFHPMLTVRESRRIEGLYSPDFIDAVEGTHYEDIISRARSDFDPHYVGISELSRCGFLLPHSNMLTVEIPYRAIVPKELDGLLISGRAISQSQNHLQITRMSPDLIVLGYLTGQIAADIALKGIQPRDYDISHLQKEWSAKAYLPEDYNLKKPGNNINEPNEINERVSALATGKEEYLWECVRLPKDKTVPVLISHFNNTSNAAGRLLTAKALAWFSQQNGNDLIEKELNELFDTELKEGYPGGYTENYDFIRGREKNVLEGLFWKINQDIALLAIAGNAQSNKSIKRVIDNTTSGGKIFTWTGDRADYFNERIDLRLVPYHNRILNLCFYIERIPDQMFIPGLEKLLSDENINGYMTEEYNLTRWRHYGADLELFIGAALARCGSETGYKLLVEYLNDIHFNFKHFALSELKSLTNNNLGYNSEAWEEYIRNLIFPQPVINLVKEIDF